MRPDPVRGFDAPGARLVPPRATSRTALAATIRRARSEGRLGPEHDLDVVRARELVALIAEAPASAVAGLDRRLDVILGRLGLVTVATGPSDLESFLAGIDDEVEGDALADDEPAEG